MTRVLHRVSCAPIADYVSKVVSNIIMLVVMAAAVAFIPPADPNRLGFPQASFLGVVSWLFVLADETPHVGECRLHRTRC